LKTCPVTLPSPGIDTVNPTLVGKLVVGLTEYKVETPDPLADTQNGLVAPYEIPQAFTRLGSVILAELTP